MSDIAIKSATVSNYQGMIAMVGEDNRVYLGKPENCYLSPDGEAPAYYDNSDHSLAADLGQHQDIPSYTAQDLPHVPAANAPGACFTKAGVYRVCQPAGGRPLPLSPDPGSDLCREALCSTQGVPAYAPAPPHSPRPLKPASN